MGYRGISWDIRYSWYWCTINMQKFWNSLDWHDIISRYPVVLMYSCNSNSWIKFLSIRRRKPKSNQRGPFDHEIIVINQNCRWFIAESHLMPNVSVHVWNPPSLPVLLLTLTIQFHCSTSNHCLAIEQNFLVGALTPVHNVKMTF